jgi:hypothetical protein
MFRRFGGVYLGSALVFFVYKGRYLLRITSAFTQNNWHSGAGCNTFLRNVETFDKWTVPKSKTRPLFVHILIDKGSLVQITMYKKCYKCTCGLTCTVPSTMFRHVEMKTSKVGSRSVTYKVLKLCAQLLTLERPCIFTSQCIYVFRVTLTVNSICFYKHH